MTIPDPAFLVLQFLNGLSTAMFLFLIASGLSLIFGVLHVLNFAHGSFYMIGAYLTYTLVARLSGASTSFWLAALGSSILLALIGGLVERTMLRPLYGREELYQLLFTYALVLILSDLAKLTWGTGQLSVPRPPVLRGAVPVLGLPFPRYNLFIIVLGPLVALLFWFILHRTRSGRIIRAAALDREMLGALGVNVGLLYTAVFVLGSWLAGLGGALVTPVVSVVPGMDVEVIVNAFIVVVIGGLGSFWGALLGAIALGQVMSFGILILPRFSLVFVYALMAIVLVIRPWGLLGKPLRA